MFDMPSPSNAKQDRRGQTKGSKKGPTIGGGAPLIDFTGPPHGSGGTTHFQQEFGQGKRHHSSILNGGLAQAIGSSKIKTIVNALVHPQTQRGMTPTVHQNHGRRNGWFLWMQSGNGFFGRGRIGDVASGRWARKHDDAPGIAVRKSNLVQGMLDPMPMATSID
mmetsp:Transcript_2649/g.5398  ORF Transcript_2649/g.5398 Transcript_2649/m.5398 type:complete len:164 (-) Transcript_2649:104-595(-)